MKQVLFLVEGVTDQDFLQYFLGVEKTDIIAGGGKEEAKKRLPTYIRQGMKIALILDLNSSKPKAVVSEVENSLRNGGFTVERGPLEGLLLAGESQVLVIAMGLDGDAELLSLNVKAHYIEDYLLKIMLSDRHLQPRAAASIKECAAKLAGVLKECGVQPLSSKLLYQVLKPVLGLPGHDSGPTGSVAQLKRKATPQIVTQVTGSLRQKLDEFREYSPK